MKSIYKIALVELQMLFYSPIAWIVLIIFTFQCSFAFIPIFEGYIKSQEMGYGLWNVTAQAFSNDFNGFFLNIQQYLYLYIPLVTMSLLSREYSSGSIKLLYSSPISNAQIILGKFLSMMVFGLVIIFILFIFAVFAVSTIDNANIYVILSGLLGIYLLICAYASIGLFMSGLTNYQVVAAMGTLVVLGVLNVVGKSWQEIDYVRDITYWLSIKGRTDEMIKGLICSEDVLYFIIIVLLFLSLSLIRLNAKRQKLPYSFTGGCYVAVVVLTITLGYITSRPQFMAFYDTTNTKILTLTPNSQDILAKLDGNVTITTYVNLLDKHAHYGMPFYRIMDLNHFKQYRRFRPRIKIKYVHYYDEVNNPDLYKRYPDLTDREKMIKVAETYKVDTLKVKTSEEIRQIIDLKPEGNRFVRLLERESGEKTFLRLYDDMRVIPTEAEISAAFKRLVMQLPKVGYLHGHGERDCYNKGDRNYSLFTEDKTFRHSLLNNGFDFQLVDIEKNVPDNIDILVLADILKPLTETELRNLNDYIQKGGNLLITGEPRNREILNPIIEQFGVQLMPGTLVRQSEDYDPDFIISYPTEEAKDIAYTFRNMKLWRQVATMPGCAALEYSTDKGFDVTPLFITDSTGVWVRENHKNSILDTLVIDTNAGEVEKPYVTMLALNRVINDKEQKIVIIGDADCISNGELGVSRNKIYAANYSLISGSFFWLSDNEVPIDVSRPRPPDSKVFVTTDSIRIWKIVYMGLFPLILVFITIYIYIRRRGR